MTFFLGFNTCGSNLYGNYNVYLGGNMKKSLQVELDGENNDSPFNNTFRTSKERLPKKSPTLSPLSLERHPKCVKKNRFWTMRPYRPRLNLRSSFKDGLWLVLRDVEQAKLRFGVRLWVNQGANKGHVYSTILNCFPVMRSKKASVPFLFC